MEIMQYTNHAVKFKNCRLLNDQYTQIQIMEKGLSEFVWFSGPLESNS